MKSIILYCSKSGKTEVLAKRIQEALGSDILKIEPEKAYGSWVSSVIRVIREKSKGVAPAFKTEIPNLDQYGLVVIGYPIWANDIPAFLANFVEKCNIRGKTIIPFATSGGTGIERSLNTLKQMCPDSNITLEYKHVSKDNEKLEQWLQSIRSKA